MPRIPNNTDDRYVADIKLSTNPRVETRLRAIGLLKTEMREAAEHAIRRSSQIDLAFLAETYDVWGPCIGVTSSSQLPFVAGPSDRFNDHDSYRAPVGHLVVADTTLSVIVSSDMWLPLITVSSNDQPDTLARVFLQMSRVHGPARAYIAAQHAWLLALKDAHADNPRFSIPDAAHVGAIVDALSAFKLSAEGLRLAGAQAFVSLADGDLVATLTGTLALADQPFPLYALTALIPGLDNMTPSELNSLVSQWYSTSIATPGSQRLRAIEPVLRGCSRGGSLSRTLEEWQDRVAAVTAVSAVSTIAQAATGAPADPLTPQLTTAPRQVRNLAPD